MNGYGQFVWPAFIFTFLSCFFLYAKTKRDFKKYQTIYLLEFKEVESRKIYLNKKRKYTKEALPIN